MRFPEPAFIVVAHGLGQAFTRLKKIIVEGAQAAEIEKHHIAVVAEQKIARMGVAVEKAVPENAFKGGLEDDQAAVAPRGGIFASDGRPVFR